MYLISRDFRDRLTTYQPQNLLSLFHSDSPWRIMTILYLPDILEIWVPFVYELTVK